MVVIMSDIGQDGMPHATRSHDLHFGVSLTMALMTALMYIRLI